MTFARINYQKIINHKTNIYNLCHKTKEIIYFDYRQTNNPKTRIRCKSKPLHFHKRDLYSFHILSIQIMSKFYTAIGLFLIGISDSVSLRWVTDILLYTDCKTKRILKQSLDLQKALLRSLVQAGVITTLLPIIMRWMGFEVIASIIKALSLIFTYTYLIFYNMDVTQKAMKVIIWRTQQHPNSMPELDKRQKYNLFIKMSYLIQSFIFQLVYYTPMSLLLMVISIFDRVYFPILLVIIDSFFNAAFYYFRKWPYDKYNVAFLQKIMPYCLGYGFFVSLATRIILPSSMAIGGYLLISQWMIINALYHTPPQIQLNSPEDIFRVLTNRDERRRLPSAYNIHRDKLNTDHAYRKQIMDDCIFMRSFFRLTEKINKYIQQHLFKRTQQQTTIQSDQSPLKMQSATVTTVCSSKITSNSTEVPSTEYIQIKKQEKVQVPTIQTNKVFQDSTVIRLQFQQQQEQSQQQKKQ